MDEATWRYVDASRLRNYKQFHIQPVQVRVKSFDGRPIAEEKKMAAEYVVMALVKALSDRYPIVSNPGADVSELRLAITGADKKGTQLGLMLEGEVLDSSSGTQVAALMKSDIRGRYDWNWSYRLAFRHMVTEWAANFRRVLDEAHQQGTLKSE